ncbi:MAG: ABC transporter permease [Longimicrobiaceae bacterium]
MSPASAVLPGEPAAEAREGAPAAERAVRPLYWSVKRELWENRSIHLAPLAVAVFLAVALAVHGATMPSHLPGMLGTDPAQPGSASALYRGMAVLMMAIAFVTGAVYCMDALSGERRDRSILFWKSLPVSDRTTVLAKAAVPLVVLPLVTLAAVVALHLVLFLLSAAVLLAQGRSVAALWGELHLLSLWPALAYALAAAALWHAPIYAFLLLVSGWARRTAALWAVLPVLALGVLEKLTMNTLHVAAWVTHALIGWYGAAFAPYARERTPFHPLTSPAPGSFLATPWLWIGLALAVAFVLAAARLRRYRAPG